MLSQGELVVPKDIVKGDLTGILSFISSTLNKKPAGFYAGGLVSNSSYRQAPKNTSQSNSNLSVEIKQLRGELKSMIFSVASNGQKIEKILDRWDGEGLPTERSF
jgi:hypothetical protein